MARRVTAPKPEPTAAPAAGGFGSVLRGSVNSMVGAAGLNLPLRAVERLTGAIENASAVLERLERATTRLDEFDDDFVDRAYQTLEVLAAMGDDTRAISERMETVELELRELRALISERFDQVPLLRQRRRARKSVSHPVPPPEAAKRSRKRAGTG